MENKQITSATITIPGQQLNHSISSLVALLFKYSSYLSDTITLSIDSLYDDVKIKTHFTLTGQQTFSTLAQDVQKKVQKLPDSVNGEKNYQLNIEWITDNEANNAYRIDIIENIITCEISFHCQPGAFFDIVFKKAPQHFLTLLNTARAQPELKLNEIEYMLPEELNELESASYGKINESIGKEQLLHDLFEHTALLFPDNEAIVYNGSALTYDELNRRANRLANYFIENGVKEGDVIGIHLKRAHEVYISILGILKAGAAYVPIDSGYPEDRVHYILEDAGVKFLISQSLLQEHHVNFKGKILYVEDELPLIISGSIKDTNPGLKISYASAAYIIYTSGSTGRPKGVVIPHASVSNLVKAEKEIFKLGTNEKIAQGFSVAFDASVEEIWLAFASGSALFPVSEEIMHSGSDLSGFINKHAISVLSTVPTMLSIMHPPLTTLKLLILGGEYCPHELLLRWHNDTLRIVNTYGPTEATVIATYANFHPEEKISIGQPAINYAVFITDPSQRLVAPGIPGELCIGGKSLATGYLNRKELTAEKFIKPGFAIHPSFPGRIYRSGDLARLNKNGQIEFLGRIDSQVKLRGYRIELSEIESQLLQVDNIKNAVVAVKEDAFKVQKLVAYILPKDPGKKLNEESCKDFLKTKLASYMVPALFIVITDFPLLPSGKIDRKKLPEPVLSINNGDRKIIVPGTPAEKTIHDTWKKYFPAQEISVTDDFFDLGGHSLLASLVVSDLRRVKGFEKISVQDIYTFRTIQKLAQHVEHSQNAGPPGKKRVKRAVKKVTRATFLSVTFFQTLSFFLFMLVSSVGLLSPFVIERIRPEITTYRLITLSSVFLISTFPALIIVSIIIKWLVIGKFREGSYPLWSWYYFRFWLVKKFVDLTPLGLLSGTPFLNLYFKLMGARIGKGVHLGSDRIRVFDLLEIGDNSSVSREAHLTGYTVENGQLIIGPVSIGKNCFIGTRSVLSEFSIMNDNSTLGELSLLASGQGIPEGENWEGSPAKKVESSKFDTLFSKETKKGMPFFLYLFIQFFAILLLLVFPLVLMIPFAITFYEIDANYGFLFALLFTIPSAAIYVVLFCLFIALVKWLIIGKAKEDDFSVYSLRYIQKWIVDMIMHFVLISFKSIYATIYLPSWLRLMGAKVGWRAEISTVNQISTDLLDIGEGSFLADSVSIGSPVVRNGIMFLRKTTIGSKTFIGNSAVLACGDSVGNNSLIGVLSVPPRNTEPDKINNASWLGSPSMYLPQRQASQEYPSKYTFNPTKSLILKRGMIEFFKITLPLAFTVCLLALFYKLIYDVLLIERFMVVLLLSPFILFGLVLLTTFITAGFKWALIGKYKPSNKPLWSIFVWKNELVNSLCESMVYPLIVNLFLGTPYAAGFFRLMGSKIGKRVFMETTEITEFDLVHIEDNVCLNQLSTMQTHLFEDRVMKMSDLYIRENCSIGAMSVVLYDSVMEEGSSIDALSLVMKGESIPANTRWEGSPAQYVH